MGSFGTSLCRARPIDQMLHRDQHRPLPPTDVTNTNLQYATYVYGGFAPDRVDHMFEGIPPQIGYDSRILKPRTPPWPRTRLWPRARFSWPRGSRPRNEAITFPITTSTMTITTTKLPLLLLRLAYSVSFQVVCVVCVCVCVCVCVRVSVCLVASRSPQAPSTYDDDNDYKYDCYYYSNCYAYSYRNPCYNYYYYAPLYLLQKDVEPSSVRKLLMP